MAIPDLSWHLYDINFNNAIVNETLWIPLIFYLLFHISDSHLNLLLISKQFQKVRGVCITKMIGV